MTSPRSSRARTGAMPATPLNPVPRMICPSTVSALSSAVCPTATVRVPARRASFASAS